MAKRKQTAWLADIREWMKTLPRLPESEAGNYTAPDPSPQRTVYHQVQTGPPAPATHAPAPARTDPAEVRRLVAQKRAELRAEEIQRRYRGNPVERRLANEAAAAHRAAVVSEIPNPYDEAIKQRRQLDLLREARR